MKKTPELNDKGVSLESFISDNKELLSGLVVFSALIAFSKDVTPGLLGFTLSFFLLGGLVLIAFELWYKMPQQLTLRLFLFRYVLLWSQGLIIFFWLLQYRTFWNITLWFPVTIIAYTIERNSVVPLIERFEYTRKVFGVGAEKKTGLQKFLRGSGILIAFGFALYMGIGLSVGTNMMLDVLKHISGQ